MNYSSPDHEPPEAFVSDKEMADARNPHAGDGPASTAPEAVPVDSKSSVPTRKWFAALAGGVGTWLAQFAADDFDFGADDRTVLVGLAVALLSAYVLPNQSTPAGDGVTAK